MSTATAGHGKNATTTPVSPHHPVVSADRWTAERKALLAREKELVHLRDEIARARRALPWERVEKDYVFDTPAGRRSLADLFDSRRQLLVQHFMLGAGWECSQTAFVLTTCAPRVREAVPAVETSRKDAIRATRG